MSDGLLHLGSMAVLVGIVYLRLDKPEFASDRERQNLLDEVRRDVNIRIMQTDEPVHDLNWRMVKPDWPTSFFDMGQHKWRIHTPYRNRFAYVLLRFIGSSDTKLYGSVLRVSYSAYSVARTPEIPLIVNGHHAFWAAALTLISACAFLVQVGAQVFASDWLGPATQGLAPVFFVLYLMTLTFLAFCALIAQRLHRLRNTCAWLLEKFDAIKARFNERQLERMKVIVDRFNAGL